MRRKHALAIVGFFGALALGVFTTTQSASAFWPWPKNPEPPRPRVRAVGQILRHHERMENIWENCDYSAWKERIGDRPISEKIDGDNFGEFCEMHRLMLDGKFGEANEIRKELELPAPRRLHRPPHPWRR